MLSLSDVEEFKGDIMESELINDKIAQLRHEIVELLNKPANRKETIEKHVSQPFTPLSDSLLDPERVDPPASTGSLLLITRSIESTMRTGSYQAKTAEATFTKVFGRHNKVQDILGQLRERYSPKPGTVTK